MRGRKIMTTYILSKKDKQYLNPEEREEVKKRFKDIQCSFAKDDDGYYCFTHRARSKSYPSISQIPQSKVDFINSTSVINYEGKMKIKISKNQWNEMGKKAGWTKISKTITNQTVEQIEADLGQLRKVMEMIQTAGKMLDPIASQEISFINENKNLMQAYMGLNEAYKQLMLAKANKR